MLVISNVPIGIGKWVVHGFAVTPVTYSRLRRTTHRGVSGLAGPGNSLKHLRRLTLRIYVVRRALSPSLGGPCGLLFTTSRNVIRRGIDTSPGRVA